MLGCVWFFVGLSSYAMDLPGYGCGWWSYVVLSVMWCGCFGADGVCVCFLLRNCFASVMLLLRAGAGVGG